MSPSKGSGACAAARPSFVVLLLLVLAANAELSGMQRDRPRDIADSIFRLVGSLGSQNGPQILTDIPSDRRAHWLEDLRRHRATNPRTSVANDIVAPLIELLESAQYFDACHPIGLSNRACYQAYLRAASSLPVSPSSLSNFALNLQNAIATELERKGQSMVTLRQRFQARGDSSTSELARAVRASIMHALEWSPRLFGDVAVSAPAVEVVDGPDLGSVAGYRQGSEGDGAVVELHESVWRVVSRAEGELIAYHEGVPGHHLQATRSGGRSAHPALMDLRWIGFEEGWALYAEFLSVEGGLASEAAQDRFLLRLYDIAGLVLAELYALEVGEVDRALEVLEDLGIPREQRLPTLHRFMREPGKNVAPFVGLVALK